MNKIVLINMGVTKERRTVLSSQKGDIGFLFIYYNQTQIRFLFVKGVVTTMVMGCWQNWNMR